jgi:hypothetical protein
MNADKLLGYVLWRAGKWYLRRRLPSRRAASRAGALGLLGIAAAVLVVRRLRG